MLSQFNIKQLQSELASDAHEMYMSTCAELFAQMDKYERELTMVMPLVSYIVDRLDTMSFLVNMEKFWDAEIIYRSVIEAFLKLINITSQNDDGLRKVKLKEFWKDLMDIENLRDSERAKQLVQSTRIANTEMFNDLILSNEDEQKIKSGKTWDNRTQLKNDWSFSGIILKMLKEGKIQPLIPYQTLQYNYTLSSHVAHGDAYALSVINLRKQEQGDVQKASTLQHSVKFFKMINGIPLLIIMELAWYGKDDVLTQQTINKYRNYNIGVDEKIHDVYKVINLITDERLRKERAGY